MALTEASQLSTMVLPGRVPLVPVQGEIRRRHDLNKVHEIVVRIISLLAGAVQGVQVVAGPWHVLVAEFLVDLVRKLGAEAEVVDVVGERVSALDRGVPVVLEVVDVHVSVAEAAAGGDVEVTNDLVHTQPTIDTATFVALGLEVLGVVFPFALLDALAGTKSPGGLGVRFTDLVAGVAASGLLRVVRWACAVARAAVVGVQMSSGLFGSVP